MLFAQQNPGKPDEKKLLETVRNFLDLWLIQERPGEAVRAHFGSQTANLYEIPNPILRKLPCCEYPTSSVGENLQLAYAGLLAKYRPSAHKSSMEEILDLPHPNLLAALREKGRVKFIKTVAKDRFVIFRATGDLVDEFMSHDDVLRPDIVPTYMVIIDFQDKSFDAYRADGPLILFWQPERGVWKIQGFGGIPV